MSRYLVFALLSMVMLFAVDYYVYRNWRRFAKYQRGKLRWTLPLYRVFLFVMPFALPAYFYFSRWWEVEPKLLRALFIGFWAIYYLPKAPIALVLVLKDFARFVMWLFSWFQERLLPPAPVRSIAPQTQPPATAPTDPLDLTDMKRMSRGAFLRKMGWSAAAVPFVVVGYGVFRSLYDYQIHRIRVPIVGLPRALEGLAIAQLSDLHAGSFFSSHPMEEAASLVNSLKPDLIAITGDFVNHDAAESRLILPALRTLKADLGIVGCLGNHDHYASVPDLVAQLRTTPIDLLVNRGRTLQIDGASLHLIGTDNTGFRQNFADLPAAMSSLKTSPDGEEAGILLAHDPTFWDLKVRPDFPQIDLMLCGHTHGGQIGFEIGPLRWGLARVAYPRWAGLYSEPRADRAGWNHLYVNRGIGTVGPPIRVGIRPEITLLELHRA